MTATLSRQNLKQWISEAIEQFKVKDLLGVSDSWMQIYDALADYISISTAVDDNLLWMIEGTCESLPDVIYQFQRLKNALVQAIVRNGATEQLDVLLNWFDRLIVTLAEKDSGKISKERSLSKPYETIFWKARDGMYISSIEGRFLHCNEALLKMMDYDSLEEALDMDIATDLYVDMEERQVMLDHLMKDGFFDHHEFRFKTVKGEERAALESCYMVNAPGDTKYIVGIMVDVSREKVEQRKSEEYIKGVEKRGMEAVLNLRGQTRRFDALLSLNDHPVMIMEPREFRLISHNKAFSKRFKFGRKLQDQVVFRDIFSAEEWMKVYNQISQSGHRHHYHLRDVTLSPPDGNSFTGDLSIVIHESDDGPLYLVQIEDRSEIQRIKELLRRARTNLSDMMDALPVGIVAFKADGNVSFVNRYVAEFTGYSSKQLRNISFINRLFALDEQRHKFQKYIKRFINGHHAENVNIELKARNGEILQFLLTTLSYQFENENKPGFVAILNNITDQLSLEKLLTDQAKKPAELAAEYRDLEEGMHDIRQSLEKLRRENAFRQEFIQKLTRKFKMPIHVVLGYASLLKKDLASKLDESQREDLGVIESHITNLMKMLDKAIEFNNLETNKVPFEPEIVGVRSMLDTLFNRLKPDQLEEGVVFRTEHQILSLDLKIRADRLLIEALLRHVVDNAVSYTKKGNISLLAYLERGRLWVEIQDTGTGICPGELQQVFEPFQGEPEGGLGTQRLCLGLSIVQRYADLMGSHVEIFSKLNEGTRFVLCVGALEELEASHPPARSNSVSL